MKTVFWWYTCLTYWQKVDNLISTILMTLQESHTYKICPFTLSNLVLYNRWFWIISLARVWTLIIYSECATVMDFEYIFSIWRLPLHKKKFAPCLRFLGKKRDPQCQKRVFIKMYTHSLWTMEIEVIEFRERPLTIAYSCYHYHL